MLRKVTNGVAPKVSGSHVAVRPANGGIPHRRHNRGHVRYRRVPNSCLNLVTRFIHCDYDIESAVL